MARIKYQTALAKALRDEMERDPSVFIIGEDVRASLRGVSVGLHAEYGDDRVLDTPISEQAFTGFAMGAALRGHRPVVEYQIPALTYTAFEPIVNQAQKFRLMTGGQAGVPVTYLIPGSGARRGLAAQHSDNPYGFFVHAGIKTVVPSCPSDAYGLFVSAIRDDDPVAVFAPAAALGVREDVENLVAVPLGSGRIRRQGTDVTVVAVGHLVTDALAVAAELEGEVSVEVLDPRSLLPFDWQLLDESISRTGALIVYDDSPRSLGVGAEIVATAAEEMQLSVRPRRIARADAPIPFSVPLELAIVPSRETLRSVIRSVAKEKD